MTIYEFSVITNTGFPYLNLKVKDPPKNVKLYLRFFDFSKDKGEAPFKLDPVSSFELNAGLVSALFEFARNIDKKIDVIEFKSRSDQKTSDERSKYEGDILITAQTESYLLHKSFRQKVKIIYEKIFRSKVPLDAALQILQNEEDYILRILEDRVARKLVMDKQIELESVGSEFLKEMGEFGLTGIGITSFDLSPILVFKNHYTLEDVDEILRNIGIFPEIDPLEWIYRQSFIKNEQIWVYIVKSGVGPTVEGLFEPYFYLLFAKPQTYLGEFPSKLTARFNQILG